MHEGGKSGESNRFPALIQLVQTRAASFNYFTIFGNTINKFRKRICSPFFHTVRILQPEYSPNMAESVEDAEDKQ